MRGGARKPEDVFPELTRDLQDAFGGNLVAVILHGSGARRDYVPGKSDLNFLVVLTDEGMGQLERALPFMRKWQRRGVATPHVVTKAFISSSLDVYPVEFLVMKDHYRLVWGEDVLAEVSFDPRYLRLQIERELKGKLLHLRRGYLETEGKAKRITQLIAASVTAYIAVFRAVLHLKGIPVPEEKRALVRAAAAAHGFDPQAFLACLDVRDGAKLPTAQTHEVFRAYLRAAQSLADGIDNLSASREAPRHT
jgi:predicted nucleotidyltransferase